MFVHVCTHVCVACRLVGVAHEAHLKKLRRIAAEGQELLRGAQHAHLQRLRRFAAAEAAQREAVGALAMCWFTV